MQQKDVDAGKIENTATATGKDPADKTVTDNDGCTVTTEEGAPALSVTKEASRTSGLRAGNVVTYTITVRNTGNVTVEDINVVDSLVRFTGNSGRIASLGPGDGVNLIYDYTVTQADVNAGRVINTATATGTAPDGSKPSGTDSVTATTSAPTPGPTPTPTPDGGGGNRGGGGNPGAPGGPAAVGPAAPVTPNVIADPPTPTTIIDEPAPMANTGFWALINLICAIITAILCLIMLIRYFGKRREEDEETGEETEIKRKGLIRLLSLIPAIAAIIIFILTEDMTLPMQLVDKWTLLMVVILIIQIIVAIFAKKKKDEEEGDEANTEATA